jgi:hypothetical protein
VPSSNDHKCCGDFAAAIADEGVPVGYSAADREWWLPVLDTNPDDPRSNWRRPSALQLLSFCPFCGTRLPEDLGDQWLDAMAGMGFEAPFQDDIPEEFKSDRWWKERGL